MSSEGTIDLSNYVALGDSITSGYTDGALSHNGQENSYANLLARQFYGDTAKFKQPLVDAASVGIGFSGNSCIVLKEESENIEPTRITLAHLAEIGDISIFQKNIYPDYGPFNNMGVAGAKIRELLFPGYGNPVNGPGNFNPFFTRMASDPPNASVLSDALKCEPTFFTLFVGNNDAFAFALLGGMMESITSPDDFEKALYALLTQLRNRGASGALSNIPDIHTIPFFTTIPFEGLYLDKAQSSVFNSVYKGMHFHEGKNPFVFQTENKNLRALEKGEMVLLDVMLDRNKYAYLNGTYPLPKRYVLTSAEIDAVSKAVKAYNDIIEKAAGEFGLALVNINKLLKKTKKETFYDKCSMNLSYKKKRVFSLDGLHPSALGQALLANEFIRSINLRFNTNIPQISKARLRMSLDF